MKSFHPGNHIATENPNSMLASPCLNVRFGPTATVLSLRAESNQVVVLGYLAPTRRKFSCYSLI